MDDSSDERKLRGTRRPEGSLVSQSSALSSSTGVASGRYGKDGMDGPGSDNDGGDYEIQVS